MIWLLIAVATASTPWSELRDDVGWSEVATKKSKVGDVLVRSKAIDGLTCLEGNAVVQPSVGAISAVTDDMASAASWTTANVAESTELQRDADGFVLYQYLDLPGWTLTADRYWVIRGQVGTTATGATYTWSRVDPVAYPGVQKRALKRSASALEPPVNFGEWQFDPSPNGTRVRYRTCADFGGSVPAFVTSWLATSQVPQTLSDLVTEAARREAGEG